MFNIAYATSDNSISQLKQSYTATWGDIYISSLYNLWYYTSTFNDTIVECRGYYQYVSENKIGGGYSIGYWNADFSYDTSTGLYSYQNGSGSPASSTDNGLSQNDLSLLTLYYPTLMSNICFPVGTPITTNQGEVAIEKINPKIHTIQNKPIVGITKTILALDKYVVQFEKDSLGNNIPFQTTVMSKNHQLYYNGNMVKAYTLLGLNNKIKKIKYNGELMYNVLMEEPDKILVNNLVCETLHPENTIAKLFKVFQNLNIEQQQQVIKWYNKEYKKIYQNLNIYSKWNFKRA